MVTFNINLDLKQSNYSRISCKQNDDVTLQLTIFNGNVTQDLTDSTVTLNALRSNNTFVKQTSGINIKDNIITVECMRDITRVSGSVKIELVITKLNKQKTTFNIDLDVVSSVITNNAEASQNVVGIIEEVDNKISQGTEIIAEVDKNKNEAIGAVNKLKEDTIARVTELKEDTIVQLNTTKKEVEELKNTTVKESVGIKDDAINELNNIKTDSITGLTNIKQDSILELNNIKNTANEDLTKIKMDTTKEVNEAVDRAIEEVTKYNIKEINDKIDGHVDNIDLHVTNEFKEYVYRLKEELTDKLVPIKTSRTLTKLENSQNGYLFDVVVKGRTLVNLLPNTNKWSTTQRDGTTITKDNNKISWKVTKELKDHSMAYAYVPNIKTSTTYTLIADIEKNTLDKDFVLLDGYSEINIPTNHITLAKGETGRKVVTITTKSILKDPRVCSYVYKGTSTGELVISNIMLLEGDHTKNTPDYFEGIKSVGEVNYQANNYTSNNLIEKMESGSIDKNTGKYIEETEWFRSNKINIKTNTNYTITLDKDVWGYVYYYDNGSYVNYVRGEFKKSYTFRTSSSSECIIVANTNSVQLIEEIKEVDYKEGKYVGKNLFNLKDYSLSYSQNLATVSYLNNGIKVTNKSTTVNGFVSIQEIKLKPNTNYRLSVDILNKGTQKDGALGRVRIYDPQSNESIGYTQGGTLNSKIRRSAGFKSRETGVVAIGFYHSPNDTNIPAPIGELFEWTDIQIEEGIVETGYESYYEGSKIEILSTGKNLISLKELEKNNSYNANTIFFFTDDSLVVESTSELRWAQRGFKLPKLKPNTVYTIQRKYNSDMNIDAAGRIRIYKNGNVDMPVGQTSDMKPITFNSGNDNENLYILFYAKSGNEKLNKVTFYDIQLEEGTIATEYESYKENKTEILLKEPLREWDVIRKDGIVERYSRQLNLNTKDFTINWFAGNDELEVDSYAFAKGTNPLLSGLKLSSKVISTNLEFVAGNNLDVRVPRSLIGATNTDTSAIKLEKFKSWLEKNSIIVLIQTETPIIEANNRILNRWDILKEDGTIENYNEQSILDGSENWVSSKVGTNTISFQLVYPNAKASSNSTVNMLSDRFKGDTADNTYHADYECIGVSSTSTIRVRVLKSKLTTQDVAGFKIWLKSNPITITYESESLTIENVINKPLTIRICKDGYIQQDITIPATIEGKYPISLGGSIQSNINAIDKIEKELGGTWRILLNLADKELQMLAIEPLVATDDISNKVNEILNVWR